MTETEHYIGNIADRANHWADSSRDSRAGTSSSQAMQPNGTHRSVPLDRRLSSCSESGFDSGFHSDRSDESSGSQPNSADITDNTMCIALVSVMLVLSSLSIRLGVLLYLVFE
jgi:hypothetical protein